MWRRTRHDGAPRGELSDIVPRRYAHERVALDAQELVEVELAVAVEVRLHEEPPHARHVASLGLGLGLGGLR